ncbi:hypothetical protein [Planococcus dechangensis]|uniref:DUF4367 domain-containing protein n=1 Tax=Planococcus dechangensis TaxID=1176255 RepID=A0ABV9MHL6_9BACL
MFWKCNRNKRTDSDTAYLAVHGYEKTEELKQTITQLEKLAETNGALLCKKYQKTFESQGKSNLQIWVARDIDGTESAQLTSSDSFEDEYRSQLAIDFEGEKFDDDFYAYSITLWYSSRGTGTLYDISTNDLSADIEKALLRNLY